MKTIIVFLIISILLFSCRAIKTSPADYAVQQDKTRGHILAIFMDGTRDRQRKNPKKRSHVQNTYLLADRNIRSLYVEGVGAGNRLRDALNAITTNKRIMRAYRFLAEHYQPRDSICLFGFSRGANQCRILSGFIYTIGITDLTNIKSEKRKQKFILDLYEQYTDTITASARKYKLALFIDQWNKTHPSESTTYDTTGKTMIEVMGLWDTVEALEIGDMKETPTPVPRHLNQLYNVKKLYHAVSLDDNRAFNYTPILATHKEVLLHPWQDINNIVEEVWFNGSHKDVGGGHKKKGELNSISLKWMLSRLEPYNIFRDTTPLINTYGTANDMRRNAIMRKTSPGDSLRGINKYWLAMNPAWNKNRIKVHRSVIDRLAAGVTQDFKIARGRTDWYDWYPFKDCFVVEGKRRTFKKDCWCIEVVDD
jgi:uncharacterized protein (DUF2235 family)